MACPGCHEASSCAVQRGSTPCTALWAPACKEKCVGSGFPLRREVLSASQDHRPDKSKGCQITSNFLIFMGKHQDKCSKPSNRSCYRQCCLGEGLSLWHTPLLTHISPHLLYSGILQSLLPQNLFLSKPGSALSSPKTFLHRSVLSPS